MARLPVVGGDNNSWGGVLNTYLSVSINSDGTLNQTAVATAINNILVKSSAYTASGSQSECILANAASGVLTITLPSAVANPNAYSVKKIDSSANIVTVATTSAQTIDGGVSALLKVRYVSAAFVSDGSNWFVV